MSVDVDVIVVGAGLSGLAAAWELQKHGITSLRVIEASERVGGRTLNRVLPNGAAVEQGGAWAGPTHTALLGLAAELGIGLRNGKPPGETYFGHAGRWTQLIHDGVAVQDLEKRDYAAALAVFHKLCATVHSDAPWETPSAQSLDAMSAGQWIRDTAQTDAARAWLAGGIRKYQGGDPDSVSLLWLIHCIQSAGYRDMLETAEDYRFIGGAQGLSIAISDRLEDRVILASPVSEIRGWNGSLTSVLAGHQEFLARAVVIAAPAAALGAVRFDPVLPNPYREAIDLSAPMSWIKFHALYDRPAWRGQATGSQFLCLDRGIETFDISPQDEGWGEIVGFLLPDSPGLRNPDREAFCLDFLTSTYGAAAAHPRDFSQFDWSNEPWIGGCITTYPPGAVTSIAHGFGAPIGALFWAGSERSAIWANYMEGAVQAGQTAAKRAVSFLAERRSILLQPTIP